jgi:ferritin-like metal-binding protein YciE
VVKLRDIIAAEEALEAAEEEFRQLNNDPRQWSAFETLDKRGKRVLNVLESQFERRGEAMHRINAARQQLLATKRAFMEGVISDAAI